MSVGSLSAGGAGKTPVVIALAGLLRRHGWCVDVLSRGFGRSSNKIARVDTTKQDAAAQFGDEPVVIAQKTGLPVWVGADRYAAGLAAEAGEVTREVHLLDDGFQHRRLQRTVDVVLLTAEDLEDALLPAGNRREGLRALRRADVIVIREEERDRVEVRVRKFMRKQSVIWSVQREVKFTDSLQELSAGPRPVAFCAIARPGGFWEMLAHAGCKVVAEVPFGDHHAYSAADIERLVRVAVEQEATGFLTTEKDRVKLSESFMDRLRTIGPVCVVGLEVTFVAEESVIHELEGLCRQSR